MGNQTNFESSSSSGRDDAIETLIDIDPNGINYRVSKVRTQALSQALQYRSNRITDTSLFDAAHSLGRYEITGEDSSLELTNLYDDDISSEKEGADADKSTAEEDKTDGDGDNTKNKVKKQTLKDGWQTRILHHHDKIIRAKNHSANLITQGAQTSTTSSGCAPPSSTTGGIQSTVSTNNAAIPPPELISALRHIFGSVSSSDLQDLLLENDNNKAAGKAGANKRGKGEGRDGVNTLPSLLSTVLNHSVFKGSSSTLPTTTATTDDDTTALLGTSRKGNVKRDWKSMFDVTNDDNNKEGAKQEGEDDRVESFGSDRATIDNADISPDKQSNTINTTSTTTTPHTTIPPPTKPSAANLESIIGNTTRDMIQLNNGTQTTRVHGLLIAVLSVLTSCMFSTEELENLTRDSSSGGGGASMDTFNEGTLLQVGALLSVLPKDNNSVSSVDFGLNDELLQYFVNASSIYEERIEIQKANLFKSQVSTPLMTTPKDDGDNDTKKSLLSIATTGSIESPPPLESDNSGGDGEEDSSDDTTTNNPPAIEEGLSSDSTMPALISRPSESSQESDDNASSPVADEEERAAEANRLLQDIVDIVSEHLDNAVANAEEEEDPEDEDENNNSSESGGENNYAALGEDDDSDEDDLGSYRESDEYASVSTNSDEESEVDFEEIDDEEEEEEEELDDDDDDDDDLDSGDEDLARALALSLAAAIEADSDNSEEENSQEEGGGGSDASDATTEAATGGTASLSTAATKTPAPSSSVSDSEPEKDTNSTPLPLLPTPPSISILPNYEGEKDEVMTEGCTDESAKLTAKVDLSSVFEPSALSSFGQLPASHVLLHLLSAVLGLMQGNESPDSIDSSGDIVSRFLSKQKASSKASKEKEDTSNETNQSVVKTTFVPDSSTASMLIASLQLSSHLRNSAIAVLNDLLADVDGDNKEEVAAVDNTSTGNEGIQATNSTDSTGEDGLPEKEDPAGLDFAVVSAAFGDETARAAVESLETKGLNRKAAAAAEVASLEHKTKLKLVELGRKRVALYSTICHLNLRCLRFFMGEYTQRSVVSSPEILKLGASEEEEYAVGAPSADVSISLSTKTRLAFLSVLTNFYSSATSSSFQSLMSTMENFYTKCNATVDEDELNNDFFVSQLCNESLSLWGLALPLLYSDHEARVELLESMLASTSIRVGGSRIQSCVWSDDELQSLKLDILCKRLRVSDMLDCFVASPLASGIEVTDDNDETTTTPPHNSLSTISLLNTTIMERLAGRRGDDNLTKLYLALCQRAMSNLILWNDLSMSSNDANDHDISGGDSSTSPGGSSGSSWGDIGSLQLKVNPSKLHFDPSKCADSISVASPGSSTSVTANQRATKVWGTVLSTTCFMPKSGVHRFAVKLDKCERGHIFVGVSTSRANLKTYVGGDVNGWGLIGTQALWHDRNKLRGDYGATFRTGAVVVATLDTNVGTLSYGLWKDGAPEAPAGPLSPQALASPRRGSVAGSTIEDWGIAFEGIPLDVKLYPAIGLYQRDDHATLYTVTSTAMQSSSLLSPISSGDIYFPSLPQDDDNDYEEYDQQQLSCIRSWNQLLCSDGVSFATDILTRSIQLLSNDDKLLSKDDNILLTTILPSLASSICLIPSCIPTLSVKYAMDLLPLVTRCAKVIDEMMPSKDASLEVELKEGEWTICIDSLSDSTGDDADSSNEYIVCLKQTMDGTESPNHASYEGISPSKDIFIIGCSSGTRVQFVEERCGSSKSQEGEVSSFEECAKVSTSSYIIDARLSLDGKKFTGIRRNTNGSSERVTGRLNSSPSGGEKLQQVDNSTKLIQTEYLLCLAVGHLSLILCSQTSLSDIEQAKEVPLSNNSLESLLSTSPILSGGVLDRNGSTTRSIIDSVWDRCRSGDAYTELVEQWQDSIYFELFSTAEDAASSSEDLAKVDKAKSIINEQTIQKGSLSRLCPEAYESAQKTVASVIYYHISSLTKDAPSDDANEALKISLSIMENGIRDALVCTKDGVPRKEVCENRCRLFELVSKFMFEFASNDKSSKQVIIDDLELIFKSIKSEQDLIYIKQQMNVRTEKSIMRFVGLRSLHLLLQSEKVNKDTLEGIRLHTSIEAVLVSLPRLICPPSPPSSAGDGDTLHTIIAGSAACVQTCIHSCIRRLYDNIGSILADSVEHGSSSLLLALLSNYFNTFHPSERSEIILKVLPSLRSLSGRVRDDSLLPNDIRESPNTSLLSIVRKKESQRLISASVAILLTLCAQLAQAATSSPDSANLIELLSENLLQEISDSVSYLVDNTRVNVDHDIVKAVQSDWTTYKSSSSESTSKDTKSNDEAQPIKGLEYISDYGSLSMKPKTSKPVSPPVNYITQLLNILHVASNSQAFIESIKKRSETLFSAFGLTEDETSAPLSGLPLKVQRRVLRVLRPILLLMDANPSIIRQLFAIVRVGKDQTHDDLLLAPSALALLRYLYAFSSSWREGIHQSILSCEANVSIFGGVPGLLQPGSFVMIEPEKMERSAKPRSASSALAGLAPSITLTSSGSGTEEIVAGLGRHKALSGVLSSIDPRTGMCEVIVLANKSHVHLPQGLDINDTAPDDKEASSRVSIRAVRISAANVHAVDELPLVLDGTNLPAMNIFSPLCEAMKSISASIKTISSTSDKELFDLETSADDLVDCCLGLRSMTVLASEPKLLQKFDKSSSLQSLLAHALEMASLRNKNIRGLSSLPNLEARIWHLLLVQLAVKARRAKLDDTSPSSLKDLFDNDKSPTSSSASADSSSKGGKKSLRTPPSAAGFFFGGERSSTRSSARAPSSRHGGESGRASASTVDQDEDDDDEEENDEAVDAAAAHLREAAIVQMAELGLPRQWAELALNRVGGTIEAAVHFCLERGGDMERLLAEDAERRGSSSSSARRRAFGASRISSSANLIRQLTEMGFPRHWCVEALTATRNNVDEALTWILTNGDRLSAQDEAAEDDQDEEDSEEEEDELEDLEEDGDEDSEESKEEEDCTTTEKIEQTLESEKQEPIEQSNGWSGVCPVRFVSGKSNINPTLDITGLPTGGFSSVGTKGVLLTRGKWYYEAEIKTAGCLQIGWADSSFVGHCQADRGDGVGDGPSSWAFDGWRRYRWHSSATEWGCKWAEGDVVGCLVDMDTKTISFTLNGKGEEIGMGVAFSGEGFRPCSGVYACVSFNRREKLRLILGGKNTEPFKYQPDGYRGIGEAIQDAIKEREVLLAEEKVLIDPCITSNDDLDSKRYICDFSDGEHGHELFAWQHRYYGSDASVHLGPGRPGLLGLGSGSKTSKSNFTSANPEDADITSRLSKILSSSTKDSKPTTEGAKDESTDSIESSINILQEAYDKINDEVDKELKEVCASLSVLYSRKLIMHTMVSCSSKFTLRSFLPSSLDTPEDEVSRKLWQVIELCTSLQASGWVGEAGAMAVAAEALGLGISTGDNKSKSIPPGMCTVSAALDKVHLPCGGLTQFLTSAISPQVNSYFTSSSMTLAACSEHAFGNEAGGSLVFLRSSLQSAIISSSSFRKVLLASVRRSSRLLAAAEYTSDEVTPDNDESNSDKKRTTADRNGQANVAPDARLASFLTGLLISKPVSEQLTENENKALRCGLFEAWCIGLLSASSPWRMVCASSASLILNTCPEALSYTASRIPTIANVLGRLESTVLRRTWAERASVPICSKHSQALIELLTSVKRAVRMCISDTSLPNFITSMPVEVDSATPISFTTSPCSHSETTDNGVASECKSWECSEGWVVSNTGWEVWTGTVEIMQVEWKVPARSSVRTLMDGGEGPPLLREGHTVMRGIDWDTTDNDDGKDVYEQDKRDKEEQRRLAEEEEERLAAEQEAKEKEDAKDDPNPAEEDPIIEESDSVGPNPADTDEEPTESVEPNPADDVEAPVPVEEEVDPADDPAIDTNDDELSPPKATKKEKAKKEEDKPKAKKKKKKAVASKLPLGTVLSIEPWDGVPAMARRVRWHLTGKEGIYRYGGGGGRFDLLHVEANEKETRVKKKHPVPESLEQCASRYGFGKQRTSNVILRLRNCPLRNGCQPIGKDSEPSCDGIMEWPDFGAGIRVSCVFYSDGAISITEKEVLYGSKDSGWEHRFGQPNFAPDSTIIISPTLTSTGSDSSLSAYDELLGSGSYLVKNLRNKEENGARLRVTSEMRLLRSKQSASNVKPTPSFSSSQPPPICFDPSYHASSMTLSKDKRSVTCVKSDGRGVAFGNVGFSKGIHYWEVKLEKAEIGSVYIGVAEKPSSGTGATQGSSLGFDGQPRLNRWLGWGFVNFRATYSTGAERVYGAHCHNGDTVGVLLDCDAGRISYFLDGVKYGEHILNDLGCAFENVSPFGFNADGCGSGGAGQGAPSGVEGGRTSRHPANGAVRPKALWPVIGLRHPGDRVTMSSKWMTSQGVDPAKVVENVLAVDEVLCTYEYSLPSSLTPKTNQATINKLPQWFVEESFNEYNRWMSGRWLRSETRGSGPCKTSSYGLDVDLDTSPFACAAACASIGLPIALLPGDRVDVKRSAGRILELQEEAVVLGTYQNRLFYRLVSQKSEGGSLMEGGGRAWTWDESEAVDGGLQLIGNGLGRSVTLPKLERFNPKCAGLKVVYTGGAVVRSDLEIYDGSRSIGTISSGTIIPPHEVIERRHNSCGVVRYLIDHAPIGECGWISSRIRGGKEEYIVEMLPFEEEDNEEKENDDDASSSYSVAVQPQYITPEDSAREWYTNYMKLPKTKDKSDDRNTFSESMKIESIEEFEELLKSGVISGIPNLSSDALIAETYERIADALPHRSEGGCSFVDCALVLCASQPNQQETTKSISNSIDAIVFEVAAESVLNVQQKLPSTQALMARIAMLRALNRRARYGLPWLPIKSPQEGSAILGGLCGFGTSLERAGHTWDTTSKSQWVQAPSISSRLRNCRQIMFTSTKKFFLDSVMDATTTPTSLSHDEYELPREVRTVRVNRLKARRAMSSDDSTIKKKHSVFSQLQREMRGWSGSQLRRGFVAKGHGGQKRAFKVKLVGEGVNDYSGPYREVFTDAIQEVTDLDPSGCSSLGVLDPTANNQTDVGEGRDLFMLASSSNVTSELNLFEKDRTLLSSEERTLLNSFSSLTHKKNESSREVEEALSYLGKLVGTATRHGIPCDLPLPLGAVWKRLSEENISVESIIKEIDVIAYKTNENTEILAATQRRLLNSFAEGMSSVLPAELLSMFTGEQLRGIVCGNPDIDVDLLKKVVEYEGYSESDEVIFNFWEVLREMTNSERKLFLQFVWARNRLPLKESDFEAPFKIQKDNKTIDEDGDYPLPSASTCFFSLSLPEYPEKEILKQKLLFAIENSTTMESDYQTNDVEINEGWRGM